MCASTGYAIVFTIQHTLNSQLTTYCSNLWRRYTTYQFDRCPHYSPPCRNTRMCSVHHHKFLHFDMVYLHIHLCLQNTFSYFKTISSYGNFSVLVCMANWTSFYLVAFYIVFWYCRSTYNWIHIMVAQTDKIYNIVFLLVMCASNGYPLLITIQCLL